MAEPEVTSMGAILKAGDIEPAELGGLVEQVNAPDELRIWAEAPDGWALDYWRGLQERVRWCGAKRAPIELPGRDVLPRARAGRIFAPSGELKWRVLATPAPARCRLVFLGEHDWLPGRLALRDELDQMTSRVEATILWGQRTRHSGGDWIELRIPHRFRYPVLENRTAGPVGVKAWTEVWSDRWGDPHFIRLRELTAYPISEEL